MDWVNLENKTKLRHSPRGGGGGERLKSVDFAAKFSQNPWILDNIDDIWREEGSKAKFWMTKFNFIPLIELYSICVKAMGWETKMVKVQFSSHFFLGEILILDDYPRADKILKYFFGKTKTKKKEFFSS